MTVKITRLELTPSDLRREAARTKDADAARRMLAIALLLEGHGREQAARQSGMDRQTLRDWVHRYNAEGVGGLFDRPHGGGAPRKLTAAQEVTLPTGFALGRTLRRTAWCAGVAAICARRSPRRLTCSCTSAASASCCIGLASGTSRCARVTRRRIARPRRRIKKLCRSGRRRHSARGLRQADRTLVAGRSAYRPARQPDLHLGGTGHPAGGAARSTLRLGLHLRRGLSGARCRRRPGPA